MNRRGMKEKPAEENPPEIHVENGPLARHDAAMTPVFFRRCGLLTAMTALLGGALLLWPGGAAWLANRLSPDGCAGAEIATRLKTGGLCASAALLLAGVAIAASARTAAAAVQALRNEALEARAHLKTAMRQPLHRRELALLAVIVLLGAAARLVWLTSPIRLDEAISFMNFSRLGVVHTLTHYHTNSHTLNSLLMAVSSSVFGESEAALRLPAFLSGLAVIPLAFAVVRRAGDSSAALLAAALVAVAPGMVEFGFLARGYCLQVMLFLLLLPAVRTLALRGGAWAALGVALLPAALMYTMLSSLYAVAVAAAWGLGLAGRERDPRGAGRVIAAFMVSMALTALLFAPMLLVSGLAAITDNYYVQPQPLGVVFNRFPASMLATWQGWWRGVPEWLPWVTVPFFMAGLARLRGRMPWWPVVTVLPMLLLLQRVVPYPRTWLFLLPLYLGTAAAGAVWLATRAGMGQGRTTWAALVVALAGAFWSPFNTAVEISEECSGWPDDRAVATTLHGQGLSPSDRVVSNSVYSRLHYYFRRLGLPHDAMDLPPGPDTRRVFLVEIPIGVEWRVQNALGDFAHRLEPARTVAEFRHGTRLSVANVRRDSTPSVPGQSPAVPAP